MDVQEVARRRELFLLKALELKLIVSLFTIRFDQMHFALEVDVEHTLRMPADPAVVVCFLNLAYAMFGKVEGTDLQVYLNLVSTRAVLDPSNSRFFRKVVYWRPIRLAESHVVGTRKWDATYVRLATWVEESGYVLPAELSKLVK